jgi:hypothetical protein
LTAQSIATRRYNQARLFFNPEGRRFCHYRTLAQRPDASKVSSQEAFDISAVGRAAIFVNTIAVNHGIKTKPLPARHPQKNRYQCFAVSAFRIGPSATRLE